MYLIARVCCFYQSMRLLIRIRDDENRRAWIGPAYPLDLTRLPVRSDELPLQYPSLNVGYSSKVPFMNLEDRAALKVNVERILLKEKDAAWAPIP
ncbi:hypothetical protein K438DRAFT_339102 [Mycena galopus ATCC 62051]|nr:hypothetical protein K438DRAFT_339102 [Mycena galopus ATCC 62051]